MKNLVSSNISQTDILPVRMGITQAAKFVNRSGRKAFLSWVEQNEVPTHIKNTRGDREYLTADLLAAVQKECA